MLKRKYIFISLAVMLFAGLAFIVTDLWLSEQSVPPDASDSASVGLTNNGKAATSVVGTPDNAPSTENDRGRGRETNSFVMNLLKRSVGSPSFDVYRVKSIIYDAAAPESSRATVEDVGRGTTRTYSINDILPDNSKIADIKRDYIVLEKDGLRKRIYFAASNGNAVGLRGYRKIDDNEYNLNPYRVFRGDADRVLDFSMSAYSRDGNMEGIQVSGIKRGTLAHNLGLKDGDVLLEVNGKPVDSLISSVKACMNAYNSDDLQLKILRGDAVIPVKYHLFWEGRGVWTPMDVLNSKAVSSLLNGEFASHLF